jgi:hypothetical protein
MKLIFALIALFSLALCEDEPEETVCVDVVLGDGEQCSNYMEDGVVCEANTHEDPQPISDEDPNGSDCVKSKDGAFSVLVPAFLLAVTFVINLLL